MVPSKIGFVYSIFFGETNDILVQQQQKPQAWLINGLNNMFLSNKINNINNIKTITQEWIYQWIKQHVSVWQHRHLVEDTGTLSPWELLLWALVWAFMCRASCSLVELWRFMPRISFCQGYVLKRIEMLQLARCQAKPKDWYHDMIYYDCI